MKANLHLLMSLGALFLMFATVNCSKGGSSGGSSSPGPAAAYGQSCGNGLITSQYGCLPQCSASPVSVMYQNQCVPIAASGVNGQCQYAGQQISYVNGQSSFQQCQVNTGAQMCQGSFPAGYVQVRGQPVPQGTCGPCYGQVGAWCVQGDYAQQYCSQNPC